MKKVLLLAFFLVLIFQNFQLELFAKGKKPLTTTDIMRLKTLRNPQISNDGNWVSYQEQPERGDGKLIIKSTINDSTITIDRGDKAQFSNNSIWLASFIKPKAIEIDNLEKGKEKPKNSMTLLNINSRQQITVENVESFKFSNDSRWFAYKLSPETKDDSKSKRIVGSTVFLRYLETGAELTFPDVTEFAFDSLSYYFAYIVSDPKYKKNGVYLLKLKEGLLLPKTIHSKDSANYSTLTFSRYYGNLAFVSSFKTKNDAPDSCQLNIWYSSKDELTTIMKPEDYPPGWFLPFKNNLKWTSDEARLFFGMKPYSDTAYTEDKTKYNDSTYFDPETILRKAEIDIWHWNDPRIKTHQKIWWKENKDRTFTFVYNNTIGTITQLADTLITEVQFVENPFFTIGYSDVPYQKLITWEGFYKDLYLINIQDGSKKLVATKLDDVSSISPEGKFITYYKNKNWYLYDTKLDTTINLTARLNLAFYDEDHDMPSPPPSYGFGGWSENDESVLIYDRYDVWQFLTTPGYGYLNQTAAKGRTYQIQYRIKKVNEERPYFTKNENIYLHGFHEKTKETEISLINLNILGPDVLLHDHKKYTILSKAKEAPKFLISRQSYDEFPDIWVCDSTNFEPKRISNTNPELSDFLWYKCELVSWTNSAKDTLEGIVFLPENYDKTRRYPVVVFFYERYSHTFYNFFQPRNFHLPCFAQYCGEDYVIFVPDVKYKIGSPGPSSVDCIVSGVRKLIDMGIADSNAIGIIGHSWSGYQTAYIITQTNLFKAAVAGAAVGNMISAYSGIRGESGLARQFQYEMNQSRIGGNLWDSLKNYIDNSPIFKAPNVNTPLLLMFGDEDGAVPWQQGIELYLAMRRLSKNCILLQYRNENHWTARYHNQLDYSIRIKQFFDTYLKNKPAPAWITNGIEYKGK